jgi:carbamoyltransferase
MYLLGIQIDHHSSVCLFKNNELVYYCEEERLSREKKTCSFPIYCLEQIIKNKTDTIDLAIVAGYDFNSSDTIASYLKHKKLIKDKKNQIFCFFKGHHLLHAAKAFYDSGFEDALIFVVDGRGSTYNLSNGETCSETSSVYFFKKNNYFKCLYKKFYTNSEIKQNLKVNFNCESNLDYKINPISIDEETITEISNKNDIGVFYAQISKHLNFFNEEGKLMGLSAYGEENLHLKKIINSKDLFFEKFGDQLSNKKLNFEKYPELIFNEKNEKNLKDLSFLTQQKLENDYENFIKKYFDQKLSNNLILTGGSSYNVVNNYKLKRKFKHLNLFIEPLCGDEGNSIAACQLFYKQIFPDSEFKKLTSLFIGNEYEYNIELDKNYFYSKKIVLEEIVDLLIKGKIIALYQGKAEGGPRALGNRSLLLDPRIFNAKDIMNTVKKREKFRPFACSILHEKVNDWFDMGGLEETPFMTYAVDCLKGVDKKIPSVIHVDGTCRVQTVTENYNKILYCLLSEFNKKTNCPILMHTSFNLAGEPLVETPEDAINTLKKSKLEYIYFADIETLVYKK